MNPHVPADHRPDVIGHVAEQTYLYLGEQESPAPTIAEACVHTAAILTAVPAHECRAEVTTGVLLGFALYLLQAVEEPEEFVKGK